MGVGAGLYVYVVVVQKFTFAISSPGEFLFYFPNNASTTNCRNRVVYVKIIASQIWDVLRHGVYIRSFAITVYKRK